MTSMTRPIETNNVVERLREEADLCRNDGADDIAALLEEAASENQSLSDRIDVQTEALERIAKYDVGLQALVEDGKDTPDNVANYYAAQIERRRKIAREALAHTQNTPDSQRGGA